MKKSFLNATTPFITEMVQVKTAELAQNKIKNAIADGATAIGFQMSVLEKQYRTEKYLYSIFESAEDKPIYFTNYRGALNEGIPDNELLDGLMFGVKCGATMVDLMGDAFDRNVEEYTVNPKAIAKQTAFIDKVHNKGGEVLMSTHIYQFRPAERVLEIARGLESRGADVVKIVTGAETQEEELENLRICVLLKKELKVPFLFLSGGSYKKLHRLVGPAFGSCMWLCFREYDETAYEGPPLLSQVLKVKQGLNL